MDDNSRRSSGGGSDFLLSQEDLDALLESMRTLTDARPEIDQAIGRVQRTLDHSFDELLAADDETRKLTDQFLALDREGSMCQLRASVAANRGRQLESDSSFYDPSPNIGTICETDWDQDPPADEETPNAIISLQRVIHTLEERYGNILRGGDRRLIDRVNEILDVVRKVIDSLQPYIRAEFDVNEVNNEVIPFIIRTCDDFVYREVDSIDISKLNGYTREAGEYFMQNWWGDNQPPQDGEEDEDEGLHDRAVPPQSRPSLGRQLSPPPQSESVSSKRVDFVRFIADIWREFCVAARDEVAKDEMFAVVQEVVTRVEHDVNKGTVPAHDVRDIWLDVIHDACAHFMHTGDFGMGDRPCIGYAALLSEHFALSIAREEAPAPSAPPVQPTSPAAAADDREMRRDIGQHAEPEDPEISNRDIPELAHAVLEYLNSRFAQDNEGRRLPEQNRYLALLTEIFTTGNDGDSLEEDWINRFPAASRPHLKRFFYARGMEEKVMEDISEDVDNRIVTRRDGENIWRPALRDACNNWLNNNNLRLASNLCEMPYARILMGHMNECLSKIIDNDRDSSLPILGSNVTPPAPQPIRPTIVGADPAAQPRPVTVEPVPSAAVEAPSVDLFAKYGLARPSAPRTRQAPPQRSSLWVPPEQLLATMGPPGKAPRTRRRTTLEDRMRTNSREAVEFPFHTSNAGFLTRATPETGAAIRINLLGARAVDAQSIRMSTRKKVGLSLLGTAGGIGILGAIEPEIIIAVGKIVMKLVQIVMDQ